MTNMVSFRKCLLFSVLCSPSVLAAIALVLIVRNRLADPFIYLEPKTQIVSITYDYYGGGWGGEDGTVTTGNFDATTRGQEDSSHRSGRTPERDWLLLLWLLENGDPPRKGERAYCLRITYSDGVNGGAKSGQWAEQNQATLAA